MTEETQKLLSIQHPSIDPVYNLFQIEKIRNGESHRDLSVLNGPTGICSLLQIDPAQGINNNNLGDLQKRRIQYGSNDPMKAKTKHFCTMIWEQFTDKIIIILVCAAIASIGIGIWKNGSESKWQPMKTFEGCIDGFAIAISVIIIVFVTAINNYQKQKQFTLLLSNKDDRAILTKRNGKPLLINIYSLLVGDILILSQGDKIPVDCLLLSGELMVDESSQTGESEKVLKLPHFETKVSNCFLISGSFIMEGKGEAIVCAVGKNTQAGKITSAIAEQEIELTPLQTKLSKTSDFISLIGLSAAVATVFFLLLSQFIKKLTGSDPNKLISQASLHLIVDDFIVGIAIIAVAIPEGLPLAVTIALAYSVDKMKKENNFVREIQSCETMGGANNICTDKTGTLTKNEMTVVALYSQQTLYEDSVNSPQIKERTIDMLIRGMCLNSEAHILIENDKQTKVGNSTECSLLEYSKVLGCQNYSQLRGLNKELYCLSYNSTIKHMITIRESDSKEIIEYAKGAPDIIINFCNSFINSSGVIEPITEHSKNEIMRGISQLNKQSYRTISLAQKIIPANNLNINEFKENPSLLRGGLTFVATLGIQDPLRSNVKEAIQQCANAGVTTRMVTGDSMETAVSIAIQSGILNENDINSQYAIMSGEELTNYLGGLIKVPHPKDPSKLIDKIKYKERIPNIEKNLKVLYRSTPLDKLMFVSALKENIENVIAVTGDGTNDAPALKKSDIGFAMGITGTQVAKDAAHIILMDDNFKSIVVAIKWGRNIYSGVRKFVQFQLTVNFIAVTITFIGSVILGESPLSTVQLLWVNLTMDTFASLALSTEPPSDDLLNEKPHCRNESMITASMWRNIFAQSLIQLTMYLIILFAFPYSQFLNLGKPKAPHEPWTLENGKLYTFFFNTFVFFQVFNQINCRKIKEKEYNVFKDFFNNPWFLLIIMATVLVQCLFVNFGGEFVHCSHLNWKQQIFSILMGLSSVVICYLFKLLIPIRIFSKLTAGSENGEPIKEKHEIGSKEENIN